MSINTAQLGKDMIAAASGVFNQKWPEIKDYAEDEIEDFTRVLARIATRHATGKLTEENAKALVRAQVKSMEIVFLAVEGMGIIMVEMAINAAIDVVKTTVNKAMGFTLI